MWYYKAFVIVALAMPGLCTSWGNGTVATTTTGNVTRAILNHPPLNVCDATFLADLEAFLESLQVTHLPPPKVVIISSAVAGSFMYHIDLHILSTRQPVNGDPLQSLAALAQYNNIMGMLNSLPVIFIGEVSGAAFGAGNEFLVQMDMRFASTGAKFGSQEASLGIFPAGGATPYLTRLVGPGIASEYLLSAQDVDSDTAAELGWVNRVFSSVEDMQNYTDTLAARIGLFPAGGLEATKRSIRNFGPSAADVAGDQAEFLVLNPQDDAQDLFDKWFNISNNETPGPFEAGLLANIVELYG